MAAKKIVNPVMEFQYPSTEHGYVARKVFVTTPASHMTTIDVSELEPAQIELLKQAQLDYKAYLASLEKTKSFETFYREKFDNHGDYVTDPFKWRAFDSAKIVPLTEQS